MEDRKCPDKGAVADQIDEALMQLLEIMTSEEPDDQEIEQASEYLYSVIGELVDEEEIDDPPVIEDDEELKTKWIEVAIPKIKDRLVADGDLHSSD